MLLIFNELIIEWNQRKSKPPRLDTTEELSLKNTLLHYSNMKTASMFIKHILDTFVMYYDVARNIHVYKMLRIRSIAISASIPFYKMLSDTFYDK